MQANELAALMLRYASIKAELEHIERTIQATVFAMGETVKTGNVTAVYSKGRGTYDYEGAARQWGAEHEASDTVAVMANAHQTQTIRVDWKAVCEQLEITAPYTPGNPTVTLKVG